ncbi:MAG: ribonuclease P protein component [Chloroflexi bacterium]|nr:ribonuclease P protein component [Chloroflexota bacterium]
MQKRHRLRKSKDFVAARREGKSWADRMLVLVARRTDNECSRFGFSVSKRVGNAVVRNRIKRRLKEAARTEYLPRLSESWDLVVIARKDAANADYHRLNRSLRRLFRRAKIIDDRANRQTANSGAGSSVNVSPASSSPK